MGQGNSADPRYLSHPTRKARIAWADSQNAANFSAVYFATKLKNKTKNKRNANQQKESTSTQPTSSNEQTNENPRSENTSKRNEADAQTSNSPKPPLKQKPKTSNDISPRQQNEQVDIPHPDMIHSGEEGNTSNPDTVRDSEKDDLNETGFSLSNTESAEKENASRVSTGTMNTEEFYSSPPEQKTEISRKVTKKTHSSVREVSQEDKSVPSINGMVLKPFKPFNERFKNVSRHQEVVAPLTISYFNAFRFTVPSDTDRHGYKHNRVVALPDDRIVVLDRNNNKLKLFSQNYCFEHYIKTPSGGTLGIDYANGLTFVNDSTVAVSCGGAFNTVNLYRVEDGKLKLIKSLSRGTRNGDLLDIAYGGKGKKYFVCLVSHYNGYERSIQLMDTQKNRRTIVHEKGLFSVYTNIESGNMDCFFVSYTYPHKIRCFSFNGEQLWNVPAPTGATALALVEEQICVVLENGIMRQITKDGNVSKDFPLRLTFTPHCMCHQKKKNRLVMTFCPLYGHVKVYQIDGTLQEQTDRF